MSLRLRARWTPFVLLLGLGALAWLLVRLAVQVPGPSGSKTTLINVAKPVDTAPAATTVRTVTGTPAAPVTRTVTTAPSTLPPARGAPSAPPQAPAYGPPSRAGGVASKAPPDSDGHDHP